MRNYRDDRSNARDRVLAAVRPDEVVAALSLWGRRAAADRIRELNEMTRDGCPDEPVIVLASLRELALFLLGQRRFVDPEIGLSSGGFLLAEWASAKRGVLAMKFLPDGMIQFAGVSPAGRPGSRLRLNGELRPISARLRDSTLPSVGAEQADPGNRGHVGAPFRGVAELYVAAGDTVTKGQAVATIEAMKMETRVTAPIAGTVGRVCIEGSSAVEGGDLLLEIVQGAPAPAPEDG